MQQKPPGKECTERSVRKVKRVEAPRGRSRDFSKSVKIVPEGCMQDEVWRSAMQRLKGIRVKYENSPLISVAYGCCFLVMPDQNGSIVIVILGSRAACLTAAYPAVFNPLCGLRRLECQESRLRLVPPPGPLSFPLARSLLLSFLLVSPLFFWSR